MADTDQTDPVSSFDFRAAPPPPSSYTPRLQWHNQTWDKIGKHYLAAREVRESYLDCLGLWPLLGDRDDHHVPILLDRADFIKYCYYAERKKELQADDHPDDYVPISYEKDEASREEWKKRQFGTRRNLQYYDTDLFSVFMSESGDEPNSKHKKANVKSKKNQYYIKAVKLCRPDAIRALFDKGTDSLDPNCIEGHRENRRGVVAHAMDHLYGPNAKKKGADRAKALQCLRLVCSLPGADVNCDGWYAASVDGPPLSRAVKNLDVPAVKILLDAGARTSFADAIDIDGQYCTVVRPSEFSERYQTALQHCVGAKNDRTILHDCGIDSVEDVDVAMSELLKLLLAAGEPGDVLVAVQIKPDDPDSAMSPRDMLVKRQEVTGESYPLSMGVITDAEAKAKQALALRSGEAGDDAHVTASKLCTSESYKSKTSAAELKGQTWATIVDLDESLQRSISQYMNINQWGLLKQTIKLLASWPKPPPPPIDYHLIAFHFSNQFDIGYSGVAKNLSATLDAYKHYMEEVDKSLADHEVDIDVQFIRIGRTDQQAVPLLQYRQSEYCGDSNPPEIHPFGGRYFGVKQAGGDDLPKEIRRRMMNMNLYLYYDFDHEDENGKHPMKFDQGEAAFLWFEGIKPTKDIDLRKTLWQTEGTNDEDDETYEIWLNEDKCNPALFTFGQDGDWAVCDLTTHLWD